MRSRFWGYIAAVAFFIEVLLCFSSWVCSVLFPELGIRSVFSGEGIRWLLGGYADIVATPLLVWLLLLSLAFGMVKSSKVHHAFLCWGKLSYRERIAAYSSLAVFIVFVVAMLLLVAVPQAVLLSATGSLLHSPFASSLVPLVSLCICLVAGVYGVVSNNLNSVYDIYRSLFCGIEKASPLFVIYSLLIQIYYTVCYVIT